MTGFREVVGKTDQVFGADLKDASAIERKKAIAEGISKIGNSFSESWQNTSLRRVGIIAITTAALAAATYGSLSRRGNLVESRATASLAVAKAKMQEIFGESGVSGAQSRRREIGRKTAKAEKNPLYIAAIVQLEKERAQQKAAEKAKEESKKSARMTCVEIDRLCYTENEKETVVPLKEFKVSDFRKVLDGRQEADLDGVLVSVMNGDQKNKLMEQAGDRPFAELMESLLLGVQSSDATKDQLQLYMTGGQANKRMKKMLSSLRPEQAKKLKFMSDEHDKTTKLAQSEKDKGETKRTAGWLMFVLGALGGVAGFAKKLDYDEKKGKNTNFVSGLLALALSSGAVGALIGFFVGEPLAGAFIGMFGSVAALASVILIGGILK